MGSRNRRMIFVHVTWSKIFTLIINQITESKKNLRLLLLNLTVVLHYICNLHHIFSPKVLFWIIIYIFFYLFQVECYKAFAPYCFFPFSLCFFFFQFGTLRSLSFSTPTTSSTSPPRISELSYDQAILSWRRRYGWLRNRVRVVK